MEFTLHEIDKNSNKYYEIESLFKETAKRSLRITNINKIVNQYNDFQFAKEKKKFTRRFRHQLQEDYLFHGTKLKNVYSICNNNFDPEYSKRHKFGYGVSFSPSAWYAHHYSDRNSRKRYMILAGVLVGQCVQGQTNLTQLPYGYDTAVSENGQVLVKFDTYQMYPAYLIEFGLKNSFGANELAQPCANLTYEVTQSAEEYGEDEEEYYEDEEDCEEAEEEDEYYDEEEEDEYYGEEEDGEYEDYEDEEGEYEEEYYEGEEEGEDYYDEEEEEEYYDDEEEYDENGYYDDEDDGDWKSLSQLQI